TLLYRAILQDNAAEDCLGRRALRSEARCAGGDARQDISRLRQRLDRAAARIPRRRRLLRPCQLASLSTCDHGPRALHQLGRRSVPPAGSAPPRAIGSLAIRAIPNQPRRRPHRLHRRQRPMARGVLGGRADGAMAGGARRNSWLTYGIVYGMVKTTVYLPEKLKR